MIRVILADDEPIIIKGLRKLIPWENHGAQVVGEAWTLRELMNLIEKEKPDLIVTDIKMPDGSGIDALKEIESRGLEIKVIFISAYQEFSYAKDALAYGAVDYLVKPVEKELLVAAIEKAIVLLKEQSEEQVYKIKLANYENKDKRTQLEEIYDRLTEGEIRPEEAARKLQALNVDHRHSYYSALVMEPWQPEGDARWEDHEKRLLLFAVSNMADELMSPHASCMIIRKGDRLCAILNHSIELDIASPAKEIVDSARTYLKIGLAAGVGKPVEGLHEMRDMYASAVEALNRAFFAAKDTPIRWSDCLEPAIAERELNEARQSVKQALLAKDRDKLQERLSTLLRLTRQFAAGSKEAAVTACYHTMLEWRESLAEVGMDGFHSEDQQELLAEMRRCKRYDRLTEVVRTKAESVLRLLEASGGSKEIQQLQLVKDYMDKHYNENITLESMASMIYMNPYYFSSFFKKHTRMNFKQYLTEQRMRQALKLLLQTDLMVYEIAERVGYNNARQFSDMFKKHYGKLPQEYKNHKT